MTRTATWIFLAAVSVSQALPQAISDQSSDNHFSISIGGSSLSSGQSLGSSDHAMVKFEGLLARSDGDTLSIELPDERVIRFQLNQLTRYTPNGPAGRLAAFRVADVVSVQAEVKGEGYLLARSVQFVRKPSAKEQAEVLQCPEVSYRWEENVIDSAIVDPVADSRRLSLVAKPAALLESAETKVSRADAGEELIASARRKVDDAFERLPNFRAREVTSMFHSTTKKVKWVPNGVISAEIAYEEGLESYSDIQLNGKRPTDAPTSANADYMRSFHNAWSTGDFESIAHCVFSGLEDSEFRRAGTEHHADGDSEVYEFTGDRASTCVAVRSAAQVAFPSYRGSLKVKLDSQQVVHVELEATDLPKGFPLDRAERSVDFGLVQIGAEQYLLPTTAYWFGCYRNSYSCFLNRVDFREYRRFASESVVQFSKGN